MFNSIKASNYIYKALILLFFMSVISWAEYIDPVPQPISPNKTLSGFGGPAPANKTLAGFGNPCARVTAKYNGVNRACNPKSTSAQNSSTPNFNTNCDEAKNEAIADLRSKMKLTPGCKPVDSSAVTTGACRTCN